MSLYDSVLNYERKKIKSAFVKLAEKSPSVASAIDYVGDSLFESEFAQTKTMTDFAYKLRDTKLTEEQLGYVVKEVKKANHPLSILLPSNSKLESAKKDYIKKYVEFYQQVFSQESNVNTFEDAVRNRFGNAKDYKKALKTIAKAEKKHCKLMAAISPAIKLNGTDKAVVETLDEILEESVNEIFGTKAKLEKLNQLYTKLEKVCERYGFYISKIPDGKKQEFKDKLYNTLHSEDRS